MVFGVGYSTIVPANRRKRQTQKDVHLEESSTNEPHNFLNLCPITESLFSSAIPVIYQDIVIMFNFQGLQQRSRILVSVFK